MKNNSGPSFGVVVIIAILLYGWLTPSDPASSATKPSATATMSTSSASTKETTKEPGAVEASESSGGYDRDRFGQAWSDDVSVAGGHNGCDTRNDILAAQLTEVTFKVKTRNCVVMSGKLIDPYSGRHVDFVKANASIVQIDHIVALSLAWQLGADRWSDDLRRDFANDPDNLLATYGPINTGKSDKSPAEWSPTTKSGRCLYATRFAKVAGKYAIDVPNSDRVALAKMLTDC